jgi:hypothetical protein
VKQDRSDKASWTLWQRLLSLFCSTDKKLHRSLTSWTSMAISSNATGPSSTLLPSTYYLDDTKKALNPALKPRPHIFNYIPLEIVNHLTDDVIPVNATDSTSGWQSSPITATIQFHYSFASYVADLPDYDAMLLQRVNFLGHTPHQLYLTLTQSNNLLLVSDGGADNGIGSTGWIITDSLGNRLVKGSSSVPGVDLRSYRAEGYAMASGLTFSHHLCLYCEHLNQLPLTQIYYDNLGLVRKLNYFFTYRLAPVKCVLHSEYDVLAPSSARILYTA